MTPETKLDQARNLRDRIIRGDVMIGILSLAEAAELRPLLRQASDAGLAEASFELGYALMMDDLEAPDPEGAVRAFQRAAEQGFGRDAKLQMLRTAYFYAPDALSSELVGRTFDELLSEDATGEVALLRGYSSYRGFGGYEQNPAEAIEWHERAAAKGNADAMFELSLLVGTGQGTEANPEAAMDWLRQAAEAGSMRAMYNLGACYATGRGVETSSEQAVVWYERAADEGHPRAAATLSMMYYSGDGVAEDRAAAKRYYDLAWELGGDPDDLFAAVGIGPEWPADE